MTLEEKAKAYDKALEVLHKYDGANIMFSQSLKEEMFPELKESEDEKIRQWIKKELESKYVVDNIVNNMMADKAFAWLEKQGEHKPADKVEPKFKVGDWVVYCNEDVDLITGIEENGYCINNGGYIPFICASDIRLWTIQDAKDGDVLYSPCCKLLWIYKDCNSCYIGNNLNYNENCVVVNSPICIPTDVVPATKEQRDLLFQEMKEAGYEWDAKQNKLKKIKQKPAIKIELDDNGEPVLTPFEAELFSMMSEAWQCYSFGEEVNIAKIVKEHSIELLERANEQKTAWTEEDEIMVHDIDYALRCQITYSKSRLDSMSSWIYNFKNRVKIQPQREWSEEDENGINHLLAICAGAKKYRQFAGCSEDDITKYQTWLKSLKDRYTWKPSDEQMQALSNAGNSFKPFEEGHKILWSLYNDLKKLKEE